MFLELPPQNELGSEVVGRLGGVNRLIFVFQ